MSTSLLGQRTVITSTSPYRMHLPVNLHWHVQSFLPVPPMPRMRSRHLWMPHILSLMPHTQAHHLQHSPPWPSERPCPSVTFPEPLSSLSSARKNQPPFRLMKMA